MATYESNPEGSDQDLRALRGALTSAHLHGGEPSTREIARRASGALSHTTVAAVLRCERVPRWEYVELTVEALGVDAEVFRRLWTAAREAQRGRQGGEDPLRFGAASGVDLRIRFIEHQTQALGGYLAHVGLVDCDQIVEWYAAHQDRLFADTIRSYWRRPETESIRAHLQRISPDLMWAHMNGLTILAKSTHVAEDKRTGRYVDLSANQAKIVNGLQTVMTMSHAARGALTDFRRVPTMVRVVTGQQL